MAGQELHLGNMLDTLAKNMKTMSESMVENVRILEGISVNTSQSINSLKVIESDSSKDVKLSLPASASTPNLNVPYQTSYANAYTIGKIKCLCDGVIRFVLASIPVTRNSGSGNSYYRIAIGSIKGPNITIGSNTTTNIVAATYDVPVSFGDVVAVTIEAYSGNSNLPGVYASIPINAIKLQYKLTDLVTQSAVAVIS